MKRTFLPFLLLLFVGQPLFAQKKVILDTDPSFDPDDVGCMAMLHTMASLAECEILAVMNSTNQKESPLSISAINQFYNRSAIPVGDYKGYHEKVDASEDTYHYYLAKAYPREMEAWTDSYDSVALYREILAGAENESITIVVIGTMHNFYGLLKSGPCVYSDLSGVDLVREKVELVATMGGNFIDGKGLDRTNWGGADELCSYTDWSCLNEERNRMCRYVIDNCPAPFMASGWEVGCGDYYDANYGNVMTGQALKELASNNIVRVAYEKHFETRGGSERIDRHSNDQCALHYAIRGEGENYEAYTNGTITLSKSGVCTWESNTSGRQGYIQKKRDKQLIADEIEALMMGDVPDFDESPPNAPKNLSMDKRNGQHYLNWEAATDPTPGSWVVGYEVIRNGELLGNAYGLQMYLEEPLRSGDSFEVRALNASGVSGSSTHFPHR